MSMFRMRNALAAGMAALALTLSTAARAATITVDSIADPGAAGICALRDAITAANTMTATNGCIAGTGSDTINFSVTGTIFLTSTLLVGDNLLTINGPPSPGITLDGGYKTPVMVVAGSTTNLNGLTIAHGFAYSSIGGGIWVFGTTQTVNVTNCTFLGNKNSIEGGAIFNYGTLTVTNSTFSGNIGKEVGGGGILNAGTLTVTHSTFSGNAASAGFGGGILNSGPEVLHNMIFTPEATIKNTIFAANVGGSCSGEITDAGYNISDDATCGFSASGSRNNTDPMLDPHGLRTTNGGPTRTIALFAGSPAIDAIPVDDCTDQASPPNPLITDQRLFPRPDAGEDFCDIGAYEYQDIASTAFRWFSGLLTITSDTGHFELASRFKLGSGGTIDPATQPVTFGLGSYAVRVPAGSFVSDGTGYLYHDTYGPLNGIFVRLFIKPTDMPSIYALIADGDRPGKTLIGSNPVPVTLTIGDNFGSTLITATSN